MASIDIKRAFASDGEKICLLATEFLLRAATGKLAKSEKLRDWKARNAVLLPTFLTEIALTVRETTAEALLKIFIEWITKQETEKAAEASDVDKENWFNGYNKKIKTRSTK